MMALVLNTNGKSFNIMILISAGHHEKSQGASFAGVTEYDLTVKWADRIALLLGDDAIRVPNGFLRNKIEFINKQNADLAIEIHFNSAKLWKDWNKNGHIDEGEMVNVGRGSETLYYPGSVKGKLAAEIMQQAIGHVFKPNRGAKEGYYQMNPAKGADYFLRRTNCTSLIIEPEFIDNQTAINENFDLGCTLIAATLLEIQQELSNIIKLG